MIQLITILTFCSTVAVGQISSLFPTHFLDEAEWKPENQVAKFQTIDCSSLWLQTENQFVLGVIGDEHQRINVKLISADQNKSNPLQYHIVGKTMVQGNVCDFEGTINLEKVFEAQSLILSDDQWIRKGIHRHGVLIGNYNFNENAKQPHTGSFSGQVFTKWYITDDGQIHYDDIASVSDGYMNNAFVGTWKRYNADDVRICHWGDYRVPNAKADFDIGAGEFSPSAKYMSKGWQVYSDAWLRNNESARKEELRAWWK